MTRPPKTDQFLGGAGQEVSDAQELNRLLDENRRLKHLVAELSLDNRILKDVLGKK